MSGNHKKYLLKLVRILEKLTSILSNNSSNLEKRSSEITEENLWNLRTLEKTPIKTRQKSLEILIQNLEETSMKTCEAI